MTFLKSKEVTFDFGQLTLHQLPAIAQIEMIEAKEKPFEGLFIACRYGVWPDKTTDELKRELTLQMANDIATAVFELSGVESKNSETDTGEDSSSG